jgi:hypothetical protein
MNKYLVRQWKLRASRRNPNTDVRQLQRKFIISKPKRVEFWKGIAKQYTRQNAVIFTTIEPLPQTI